ncbi:MAG: hypothetical protein HY075_04515 [Deltaproteobacteria bacterium]|nr:hypothetical protein [Deltaproteobacteria bacterium]
MTTPASNAATEPSRAYEESAELLYSALRFFLPEDATCQTLEAVAGELVVELPRTGYQKYAKLLCLKLALARLATNPIAKPLSSFEIGAVVAASEGSVRTRLERARGRLFPSPVPETGTTPPAASHLCIRTRELVEDWDINNPRLGQFTVPPAVSRAVGGCARCEQILQQRLASLGYFHELQHTTLPERLKAFPVTPLFIKEGRRMLLNWSVAPWYVKALFEGLLATTLVLGVVLSIPRIKSIYEFWLERRLDLYSIAELAAGIGRSDSTSESAAPNATASPPAAALNSPGGTATSAAATTQPSGGKGSASNDRLAVKPETEFIGRDSEIPSSDKIYRVLIKTDSPETIKDQVVRLLSTVHYVSADEDATVGADLPGGVMFDVFVPLKSYKQTVNELVKMGETKFIITRAKERGVAGKAHLKIWLQRI